MRYVRCSGMYCLVLVTMIGACPAEDAVPGKFYKLEFVVKEVDGGKVLNARSYSALVATNPMNQVCSIRTGSRMPGTPLADLGVDIDCGSVKEIGADLALHVGANITSVLQESAASSDVPKVIRHNTWSSTVIVPLRKPTVIFSSDDVTSMHKMQLELTATPIT